jgi:hypothetical protein
MIGDKRLKLGVVYRADQSEGDRRTFIVLGAPRGGTSVVSGAIQLLGISMGSTGDYQHEDPLFRTETPMATKRQVIGIRNKAHARWGWKLPNTVQYFNEVRDIVANPVFITVLRNPLDVMMSAVRHDKDVLHEGHFQTPFGHYHRMSAVIRENPRVPVFLFSYEALIGRREDFVDDLIAITGATPTDEQRAAALDFVNPDGGYRSFEVRRA